MAGSFGAYIEQRKAGVHQTSPEAAPSGAAAGQSEGQTSEPTTYEQARDMSPHVPEAVRRTWQAADREENLVRQEVERLIDDKTLANEFKAEKAQALYERKAQAIAEKRQQTREALLKAADAAYRASIPVYSGQALSPGDTNALLADQQESERIIRTIENRKSNSGPFAKSFPTTDFLREQYRRGLETGGIEGGSIIRGTIRAAEELGVDLEDVLRGVRQERHMEYVDKSRLLAHYASSISTQTPELPRRTRDRLQRLARGSNASTMGAHRASHALVGGEREPIAKTEGGSHNRGSASQAPKRSKKRFK